MSRHEFLELKEKGKYRSKIDNLLKRFEEYAPTQKFAPIRDMVHLPEETLKDILKVMDIALMNRYTRILVKQIYKKHPSPASTIWYAQELINERRLIEAEELLRKLEKEGVPPELEEKLYFNMAVALIHMQRIQEGRLYMEKCETVSKTSMNTSWAYFYLYTGDWTTSLPLLEKGKMDEEDSAAAYLLLVQHHTMHGETEKARRYLNEGLRKHADFPKLLLEKIRLHYRLKQWDQMRETIDQLMSITPYHDYKIMCEFYIAESYYATGQLDILEQYLKTHEILTKKSHFKNFTGRKDKPSIILDYKPTIQKYNYCVPATTQMIMSMFSHEQDQDEIASSIFDVVGSKLSKAMDYLARYGFSSRLFLGDVHKFKQLIDQNVAVMVVIDYLSSSHVQLLVGYDDNLQVFHVQDPNFREPHLLEYQHVEKQYGNNFAFSIAIVPYAQEGRLAFLDISNHQFYEKLLMLSENGEPPLETEVVAFLENHQEHPLVAVFSVKYFARYLDESLLEKMILKLEQQSVDPDYRNLISATAYMSVRKNEQARNYLEKVKNKKVPFYYYLVGRLYFSERNYPQAIEKFKRGLQLEPDDHILWSYLALATTSLDKSKDALRFSEIALDINRREHFVLVNHGVILFDNEKYQEAREFYSAALRITKDNAQVWYERALCDMKFERYHKAARGLKVAMQLEPTVPLPYYQLAYIYEFINENREMAEEVLKNGMLQTNEEYGILIELAELYERDEKLELARTYYTKATEKEPDYPLAFLALCRLLKAEEKVYEFFGYLNGLLVLFKDNSEFLFQSGKMVWEITQAYDVEEKYTELALTNMETGIKTNTENLKEVIESYIGLIEDTPFNARGIEFLKKQFELNKNDFLYPAYIGCLYEAADDIENAIHYQEQSLSIKEDILPLFRLGEMYSVAEEYEKAKGYYERVIAVDPTHVQAMLNIADIAGIEENPAEKLEYGLKAFHVDPFSVSIETILSLMDDRSTVEEFLQQIQELKEKIRDQAFIYDTIAYVHGKLDDIQEEENYIMKALEISPENPHILHHYIKLLIKKGQGEKAKSECLKLIQNHVSWRLLYETLIHIYNETNTIPKLDSDLKRLKLPKDEKSLVLLYAAVAYEKEVTSYLEEELMEKPKGFFKKLTKHSTLSFRIGTAMTLYELAIKFDRENSLAVLWFADFYLQLHSVEDAIKVLEKSLKKRWNPEIADRLAELNQ